MRALLSLCLFTSAFSAAADIGRFIEPIQIAPKASVPTVRYVVKSSAFVSPHAPSPKTREVFPVADTITIDRQLIEKRLGEALAHRFQATGRITAFLTREWTNCLASPNFIVKIKDCAPDELTPSTFVRFSIWDQGKELGGYAEPIRMAHFVEVFYTKTPLVRGARLSAPALSTRLVDVLKQHAGSVPSRSRLSGYQLDSNLKANSPLKWSNLSKVVLVKKGQIVDVYASGNGIYVTMKGMALHDGVEGGSVTVRNLSSDKEFPAKVLNENSVKVHL